ncbi:RICIN domain-containing protein [Streptomyces griseoviridis]|uniref:RICIN domain-containing protein n=1 Tax=Streptomyces griseoviridis TaxID=45398 RepID=UPI0034460405
MLRTSALAVAAAVAATASLIGPLSAADATTDTTTGRTETARPAVAPGEIFALKNKHANECLDGNASHKMWSCNGSQVQKWRFADAGQGKIRLVWNRSGECVYDWGEIWHVGLKNCAGATSYTLERSNEFYRFKNDRNGGCVGALTIPGQWVGKTWYATVVRCSSDAALWIKQ